MPLIEKLGCSAAACHGAQKGRGGLALSLFGGDPDLDYEALVKAAGGRRIDKIEPEQSLLLLKLSGALPHAGGAPLPPDSASYRLWLRWIARGAPYTNRSDPAVLSLALASERTTLSKGQSAQLTAALNLSDGSRRDVTGLAAYASSDTNVVVVDEAGRMVARGFGESVIVASHLRRTSLLRVLVPQPLPAPFPPMAAHNRVDELVHARLKSLGFPPSEPCSDPEFLRRVHLDAIGTLPTPDEARAFLADADPRKRARLIDRLLEREEYADFWALKWGDLLRIKSEYPVRVWPKAVQTYHRWVRASLAENKPADRFARELITATGSNFRDGPANFLRAVSSKDPQSLAESAALVFMGARLGCARCHAHPVEAWGLDDDLGLAAFFARVAFKPTQEWKEEIVYFNPKGAVKHPRTRQAVKPRWPGGPTLQVGPDEDPRTRFAAWLTEPQNPWFARNLANRVWFWLLGRGLVQEPDDQRPTNPPTNPELLDFLAGELAAHKYDLKHLYRLILNSRTYQASSKPTPWNAADAVHFSHYQVKRLGAEPLLDAISQVTETTETFASQIPEPYSKLPPGHRAAQLADGNVGVPFLELFGRPPRDTPYEGERTAESSLWQALYFISSEQLEAKVTASPRLQRLVKEGRTDAQIVDELYRAAVARPPEPPDKRRLVEYLAANKAARLQALGDVTWALLNTKEFLFVR